jgi:UTP--glucose-1-phosphate uridylyltransferase
VPKELLPIIDKPIIQYAVEEALAVGITELGFVTGRTKRPNEDHFVTNPELERGLHEKGKDDLAAAIRGIIPDHVNCIFIRQPQALGLGHAVLCAAPVIGRDPLAVLLADDVVTGTPSPTGELIAAYARTGCTQLSVMDVAPADVSKYGIIRPGDTPGSVAGLVEKPQAEDAPRA